MPHNVEDVIGDIEDAKWDLRQNLHAKLKKRMEALLDTAITHVKRDADWRGGLVNSLRDHGVDIEWEGAAMTAIVGTDKDTAPYAPFVEFGTGQKSEEKGPGAILPQSPDEYPVGFPYDAPDVDPQVLVGEILEWMETKPVQPKSDKWTSAMRIASSIVDKGTYAHPFLRPAWFKHRLQIRDDIKTAVKNAFR